MFKDEMSNNEYVKKAEQLIAFYKRQTNFQRVAGDCRVLSASQGRLKIEFDVTQENSNIAGALHGGFTATLIDVLTTTAILLTGEAGVSADLHVSYLSGAAIGDTVIIDSWVTRQGRTIIFTHSDVYSTKANRLIATAMHTKVITPSVTNTFEVYVEADRRLHAKEDRRIAMTSTDKSKI